MSYKDIVFYLVCAAAWFVLLPLFVVGGARSRATGVGFVSGRPRRRLPSPSTPPAHRDDVPIFLLGAQPPLRARLARLRVLGASIQPPTVGRTAADPAIPTRASAGGTPSTVARAAVV